MGCDNDAGSNKLKENSMVMKTKEDREMIFSISSPRRFLVKPVIDFELPLISIISKNAISSIYLSDKSQVWESVDASKGFLADK